MLVLTEISDFRCGWFPEPKNKVLKDRRCVDLAQILLN